MASDIHAKLEDIHAKLDAEIKLLKEELRIKDDKIDKHDKNWSEIAGCSIL